MGVPSIVDARSGCVDIIRDGVNGIVYGGSSGLSLESAIGKALRLTLAEYENMTHASRLISRAEFSATVAAERYAHLARCLLDNSGTVELKAKL